MDTQSEAYQRSVEQIHGIMRRYAERDGGHHAQVLAMSVGAQALGPELVAPNQEPPAQTEPLA